MKRLLPLIVIMVLVMKVVGAEEDTDHRLKRWAVLYAQTFNPKDLDGYSLIVLDSGVGQVVDVLHDKGVETLGYLSLAEVSKARPYFEEVRKKNLLLEENKNWPGSFMVDIRNPQWAKMVIEELIPKVLFRRFQGLFLDTIDNAIYLEEKEPEKYKGMKEAAIKLIKAIRLHYPSAVMMLNRGYDILAEVAEQTNMVLGESVYTTYNFSDDKYVKVPTADYEHQVQLLQDAMRRNPLLEVYTLDYWNKNDSQMIREIYNVERKNGFIPYVSTIDLQEVIAEPQ